MPGRKALNGGFHGTLGTPSRSATGVSADGGFLPIYSGTINLATT